MAYTYSIRNEETTSNVVNEAGKYQLILRTGDDINATRHILRIFSYYVAAQLLSAWP